MLIMVKSYPNPLVFQRADPCIYRHTDGYYYFTASVPAYDRIENSKIAEVVVTDAVPVPLERQTGKIKVLSIAPLVAKTINGVYNNSSISELFD